MKLDAVTWGEGERVILVHGSLLDGPTTWERQRTLAERWSLLVVQRRGFGASPDTDGEDFERDAEDLCELLHEPAHLVGHSYGAIGALLAAARRTDAVRSLTVVEPTSVTAATDDPQIAQAVGLVADWWQTAPEDPDEFLSGYGALLGIRVPNVDSGPDLRRAALMLRSCRTPWTAEIPWDRLAAERVRVRAISGGHSPALDAVAAAVARRTGGDHRVISGAGHAVQRAAGDFNPVLEEHLLGG